MIPLVLFWLGIAAIALAGIAAFGEKQRDAKQGMLVMPALLLLAAAVAKYLGY